MDKFGVFNLLNSLLNIYKSQKKEENPFSNAEYKEPTPNNPAEKNSTKRQTDTLGDRILKISSSHDEFVKRVKKTQEKTP